MRESGYDAATTAFALRFVTIGSQDKAESFCAKYDPDAICIGDADKRSYIAMGLEAFDLSTLQTHPALQIRRAENTAAGFDNDWPNVIMDDAAQLPGAAAIDGSGVIRWLVRGAHPGDLPPVATLFREAKAALAS